MSKPGDALALVEARALRREAWALVRADIQSLRTGLNSKSITTRLKNRASEEIAEAIDHAGDVAAEHQAIVAGTILALVGWFLRKPIGAWLSDLLGFEPDDEPSCANERRDDDDTGDEL